MRKFIEKKRLEHLYRPIRERIGDFSEVEITLNEFEVKSQASRCMACGIPFCHGSGCPLGNSIPDFNAAAAAGDWKRAWDILSSTSFFPEFTSRVCPALCEGSCTASMDFGAVMTRQIEKKIVDTAFENGWVTPTIPKTRNGKNAAVIGSGPSGLSAAMTLNSLGYSVTVYEKNAAPGGLLRYGIPDFKLSKTRVARRVKLMEESGILFVCDTQIGLDISGEYVASKNDIVVVATGTPIARDLTIEGRKYSGVHFALEFLGGQERANAGEIAVAPINAKGKKVLVIGGGDTGSDCVGTANRQGATAVTQIEIMPKPPVIRSTVNPWPDWPRILRTSSSHEEGCERRWLLNSLRFIGNPQTQILEGVEVAPVVWESKDGRMIPVSNLAEKEVIPCDLAFLALGFIKRDRATVLASIGLPDTPSAIIVGDSANGPSLVVRAIADAKNKLTATC